MTKLIPILVFLFASLSVYGQNWNPLNPSARNYFTNVHGYLRGMRIDSAYVYGGRLHYYPFKTLRGNSDCLNYNWGGSGSWLGEDIIRRTDGVYLFPNRWGDTIKIKTLANMGDSWNFYQDSGTIYYTAEITAIDTMTILGSLDSVKRISIYAYDNGMALVTDSFNSAAIILSKSHGFYQTMELYMFPFHAPGSDTIADDYYFKNSIKPADFFPPLGYLAAGPYAGMFRLVNYIPPVYTDIYDWSVGDIYQYSACHGYSWGQCTQANLYKLDTIVGKTVFSDSVIYQTAGWRSVAEYSSTNYSFIAVSGAEKYVNSEVLFFEGHRMPEEFDVAIPPFWGDVNPILYYYPEDESYCTNGPLYCSFFYCFPSIHGHSIYKTGVGTVKKYIWQYGGDVPEDRDTSLIYFVKNGVPCGTYGFGDTTVPVVTHVVNINETSPITIYPNPTSEQLNIETSLSNYSIALVNAIGQVVYSRSGCSNKQTIDVGRYPGGMYHLRIETAGHEIINRKVALQH